MIEQGSAEWKEARLGCVTASRVADVIARTKSGWGASRANYMAQLIAERLTGVVQDSYVSKEMQWGSDTEGEARTAYEFYSGNTVEDGGYVLHPALERSGASPDGLIGTEGLVETKCPNTATHIETLLTRSIPGKYQTQMQWQMACTGRAWCDWVSYDPRMPEQHRLFVRRCYRNPTVIQELETLVGDFLKEIDEKIAALNRLGQSSTLRNDLERSVNLLAAG